MKRFSFRILHLLIILIISLLAYLNVSVFYSPSFNNSKSLNEDVYHQLQFLKCRIDEGGAKEMQELFPEGFIFTHVLNGLSWINLVEELNKEDPIFHEAIKNIDHSLQAIKSDHAKSIFNEDQFVEYGIFYQAWSNYLEVKRFALYDDFSFSRKQELFKSCDVISNAYQSSETPFLTSYKNAAWPADNFPAILSLKLYDEIHDSTTFQPTINRWLNLVKSRLDPLYGMIPHQVYPDDGSTAEGPRGSSQSLMLNFLIHIDSVFANEQFEKYKTHFLAERFFLPGIREYPDQKPGFGDIDSGPVILGIGGAASIVGQKAMAENGDNENYTGLRNCIKSFGLGFTWGDERNYLFGNLTIADAWICWSNSFENHQIENHYKWRMPFHIMSIVISFILVMIFRKTTVPKK